MGGSVEADVAEGGAESGLSVVACVAVTAAVCSSVISVLTDGASGRGRLGRCVGAARGKSVAKRALVALAGWTSRGGEEERPLTGGLSV